jgi:uncharacterized protein YecT (DUF1311 family)
MSSVQNRTISVSSILIISCVFFTLGIMQQSGFSAEEKEVVRDGRLVVEPLCLQTLLGNWDVGEPQALSVNLEGCGIVNPAGVHLEYEDLGTTSTGVHVLLVKETAGDATMQSVLFVKPGRHNYVQQEEQQFKNNRKESLITLGQIQFFGEEVQAELDNDLLVYTSGGQKKTLQLNQFWGKSGSSKPKPALSTEEILHQQGQTLKKLESTLDKAAADLQKKLDQAGQKKFDQAQKAWKRYRSLQSEITASAAKTAENADIIENESLEQITRSRIGELNTLLKKMEN